MYRRGLENKSMVIAATTSLITAVFFFMGMMLFQKISNLEKNQVFSERSKKEIAVGEKLFMEKQECPDYDQICRSICRIGYDPYSAATPPEQSIASYKLAYEKGFRILLCDLQFTSDNVPVLWHDPYLNQYGSQVYKDGKVVDQSLELYIRDMTYEELLGYDFGFYKGARYADTKIMTLNQMCELCRNLGCELYIEIKGMDHSGQAEIACDIVSGYGLADRTSWCGGSEALSYVLEYIPEARVATMPKELTDNAFQELLSLKNGKNKVFFFAWDSTVLTDELVKRMAENDIEFEQGNMDDENAIINYFAQGEAYQYCTGINTGSCIAGKLLLDHYRKKIQDL